MYADEHIAKAAEASAIGAAVAALVAEVLAQLEDLSDDVLTACGNDPDAVPAVVDIAASLAAAVEQRASDALADLGL